LTNRATPKTIDYTSLYENIGDIVIEKAHSGDPVFERVYEWAWKKSMSKILQDTQGVEKELTKIVGQVGQVHQTQANHSTGRRIVSTKTNTYGYVLRRTHR
jgi:hypothetical protein